ncbi:MAG: site-specific integrase, partial [Kiritimatiellaeota bacterium]|nr:site-specific integrase [Kiritimatiellota bacterium]
KMKHGFGSLYKRDAHGREHPAASKIEGAYWIAYTANGKRIRQPLRDDAGRTVTELAIAEKLRMIVVSPYITRDHVEALKAVQEKITTAETALAVAQDAAAPVVKLADAFAMFEGEPTHETGAGTMDIYRYWWNAFTRWLAEQYPAAVTVRDVTEEIAKGYAAHLRKRGVSKKTFNSHRAFLMQFYSVLAKPASLPANPWKAIPRYKLGKMQSQSRRVLGNDELRKVCTSATGELRTLLAVGLYLGARLGDAVTLQWSNVDLRKMFVEYRQRKTGREIKLPLHPALALELSATRRGDRHGFIMPVLAKYYLEKGVRYVTNRVQYHFRKCGIETARKGNGVRKAVDVGFHSLRHSAVTLLREAGVPLSVTMGIVGHTSTATHDLYTQHGEAALKSAVAMLPSVFSADAPALPPAPVKMIDAEAVRVLAEKLTPENAGEIRAELLKLAS